MAYTLKADEQKTRISSAVSLDKTHFTYSTDQNNIAENGYPLKVWGVSQNFSFPTLYSAELRARKIEYRIAESELKITTDKLIKQLSYQYVELQVLNEKIKILKSIDSLYATLYHGATLKNSRGEITPLDLLTLSAKQQQIKQQLNDITYSYENSLSKLKTLMAYDSTFVVSTDIVIIPLTVNDVNNSPYVLWLNHQQSLSQEQIRIEKNKRLPDISLNYFLGSNSFSNARYYHGFEAGIAIPLFHSGYNSRIKAYEIAADATAFMADYEIELLGIKQKELLNSHKKFKELIDYYNDSGQALYTEIIRTATLGFRNGEIDFYRFATSTETALQIRMDYLNNLIKYTEATLELNYLTK